MLCSDCGQEIRPVVAIDIDGTLGEYHAHLLRFMSDYLGQDSVKEQYTGAEPFSEYCMRNFTIDLRTFRDIKLAYRQGAQKRSMPIKEGAYDLVADLNDAGAEIWITTTRPYLRLDGIDPDTRFWLDRHKIEFYGLLYDEAKYVQLSRSVDPRRVVAILDDLPDQLEQADQLFPWAVSYMLRTPYNSAILRRPVVYDLREAKFRMKARVQNWRGSNGRSF